MVKNHRRNKSDEQGAIKKKLEFSTTEPDLNSELHSMIATVSRRQSKYWAIADESYLMKTEKSI